MTYSIKQLSELTGIKCHTLRAWETRYGIVFPKRTDGNIRYYTEEDIKIMLNVSTLYNHGYKISHIAKMSASEICCQTRKTGEKFKCSHETQVKSLISSMISLQQDDFEKTINDAIMQMGFEKMMTCVVFPFLARIGVLWASNSINVAQEHFISNLIRQKLIVGIDAQTENANPQSSKYMLFLPEGEDHEIPLLFAHYLVKQYGGKVCYLGHRMPIKDVEEAYKIYQPDFLLTILTSAHSRCAPNKYLQKLSKLFPKAHILVTGSQVVGNYIEDYPNVHIICKTDDLVQFVEESNP